MSNALKAHIEAKNAKTQEWVDAGRPDTVSYGDEGSWVYFVHSYMIKTKETGLIAANADYGIKVPAVIQQKNFINIR